MDAQVLFHGVISNADGEITAGPAVDHVWNVGAIYCANVEGADVELTLYHRLAGPTDRHLAYEIILEGGTTIAFGPLVLENGQSLRGEADTANSVEVIAYGYEEDIS